MALFLRWRAQLIGEKMVLADRIEPGLRQPETFTVARALAMTSGGSE